MTVKCSHCGIIWEVYARYHLKFENHIYYYPQFKKFMLLIWFWQFLYFVSSVCCSEHGMSPIVFLFMKKKDAIVFNHAFSAVDERSDQPSWWYYWFFVVIIGPSISQYSRPFILRLSTFDSNCYSSCSFYLINLNFFTRETRHTWPPCNKAGISKLYSTWNSWNSIREFQICLKHYSSFNSYWIILNDLPEKLFIQCHPVTKPEFQNFAWNFWNSRILASYGVGAFCYLQYLV